jgi:hypothetical protein
MAPTLLGMEGHMQITKEMLDERELALLGEMNAVRGALIDLNYWRMALEQADVPVETEETDGQYDSNQSDR